MSKKRKSEPGELSGPESPAVKRTKSSNGSEKPFVPRREKPQINQTYGQMSAFPGLNDQDYSDEDSDEDEIDDDEYDTKAALRYLRNVRSEAQGIPDLLVAPKQALPNGSVDSNEGIEDPRGYYEDGAYVAAPVSGPIRPPGWHANKDENDEFAEVNSLSAEEAYTKRFLAIFKASRRKLEICRSTYKNKEREKLGYKGTWKSFNQMTHEFAPTPMRVAAIEQDQVLKMLQNARHGLERRKNFSRVYSQWLWALLCASGDVHTMDSDAISIVRELAKKAVWVGIGYMSAEVANTTAEYDEVAENSDIEELADELPEELAIGDEMPVTEVPAPVSPIQVHGRRRNTSSPEPFKHAVKPLAENADPTTNKDMEAARDRLLSKLECSSLKQQLEEHSMVSEGKTHAGAPDETTRATIDMIVTIAGEMYGQRDMLEFRSSWSALWA